MRSLALVILGATILAMPAVASDDDIRAIVDRAQRIKQQATTQPPPAWLYGKDAANRPMSVPEAGSGAAEPPPREEGRRVQILASWALGEPALKDLFRSVAGRDDVQVLFRGVLPGETFGQGVRRLHAMLRNIDPLPNVSIDPMVFRQLSVSAAPVVAFNDGTKIVAHATGLISPEFISGKVQEGATGDLGVLGPTVTVVEPDLIDVLQANAKDFDLEGYKRRALEEFWRKARFEELPEVTDRRERVIDPTVVVTKPITDAEGRVLVEAGRRINPLDKLPFTQRLVVFDARSPGQVAVAAKLAAEVQGRRRVTLVMTAMDRDGGWEGLDKIEERVDGPVYLLTPDIKSRFKVERVPTLIEANGRAFVVTEIPPEKDNP
ncbi:TrbC family F-type conjugative pilus assembly protein [Azospirillum argentinense]|uniref:Conjugal transfer pilus assembly protein TraW n=1 Tax=Azospirillum argentinense TaxID=2970906 RepID=A0A5B0KPJ2_9PROT|nr:TrbC family F-type conjugative pilus assembly protein [Azospirillum argentinense]KAA1053875.1 TrbC_Ftype protein [Azospirillum argentinense]